MAQDKGESVFDALMYGITEGRKAFRKKYGLDDRPVAETDADVPDEEPGADGSDDLDDTAEMPDVGEYSDGDPYDDVTNSRVETDATMSGEARTRTRRSRDRFDRVEAARQKFGSSQEGAKFEDSSQVWRLRNSVDRHDRESFASFKSIHLGAANRKQKCDYARNRQIERRQTYRQLALGTLFEGESLFDGLMGVAGVTFGYMLGGGIGAHTNKHGLTRSQTITNWLDKVVDWADKRRDERDAVVGGIGSPRSSFLIDRVLKPARNGMHWLTGKPIPESVSTLATYQLGIMSRAMEEMSAPGADPLLVRKMAFEDMKSLYEIAEHDGISKSQLDVEAMRIGARLDSARDARNHLSVNFAGEERQVTSRNLRKAFSQFVNNNFDMDALERQLFAAGKQPEPAEPVKGAEAVPGERWRKWVPDDELRRVKVSRFETGPYVNDDYPASENVSDIARELRERGSFGDALDHVGGFEFKREDLPSLVNAYRHVLGESVPEESMGEQSGFGNTLMRVREMISRKFGNDPRYVSDIVDIGIENDLCNVVNDMYEGGFDLSDPWGEAKRSFESVQEYLADAQSNGFGAWRGAAERVGEFMVDMFEHEEGEPYKFGNIGNVQRDPNRTPDVLDDLADRMRFAFTCEPASKYAMASALQRHVVAQQPSVFSSGLLEKCGNCKLSYFDFPEVTYSNESPTIAIDTLGDTFDPSSVTDMTELEQEMSLSHAFSGFGTDEKAVWRGSFETSGIFSSMALFSQRLRSEDVRVTDAINSVMERMGEPFVRSFSGSMSDFGKSVGYDGKSREASAPAQKAPEATERAVTEPEASSTDAKPADDRDADDEIVVGEVGPCDSGPVVADANDVRSMIADDDEGLSASDTEEEREP